MDNKIKERKFDFRVVFACVLVVVALAATIVINANHANDSTGSLEAAINIDNGDAKINWERYATYDIELSEPLNIARAGVYHLTGTLDGGITIRVSQDDPVKLILDNVSIRNDSGPAIACFEADDLVIELIGENYFEDGALYSADYDEDVTGVIYSKADLTFQGKGALFLISNYFDGIISKDDLKFNGGRYVISANDDGIRGKDSVYIMSGDFVIKAGADGIKSTNETDVGKGFILVDDGTFNIEAGAKGIKAINNVLIGGGDYTIISSDDSVHSDNYVGISGGTLEIKSSDDGMHANKELIIDGGTINIVKAYEGLEAQVVTINGGNISLYVSDDGINAGGGVDESTANRVGAGVFDMNINSVLTINGGSVYVNSAGDGIDSNGYLYFNGGTVVVDGPTNNGNGALDAGAGIIMNGGEVIAVGSSGMAETLGSTSNVYNISVYFSDTYKGGTNIEIKNSQNEVILSHEAAKSFNHLAAGSNKFELGSSYTIYIDGEKYTEFKISDITTTIGESNSGRGAPPAGRF